MLCQYFLWNLMWNHMFTPHCHMSHIAYQIQFSYTHRPQMYIILFHIWMEIYYCHQSYSIMAFIYFFADRGLANVLLKIPNNFISENDPFSSICTRQEETKMVTWINWSIALFVRIEFCNLHTFDFSCHPNSASSTK